MHLKVDSKYTQGYKNVCTTNTCISNKYMCLMSDICVSYEYVNILSVMSKYISYEYVISYEHVITHISRDPRPLARENENENRVGFSFFNLSKNYIIHESFFRTSPKNCFVNNLILIQEYLDCRINSPIVSLTQKDIAMLYTVVINGIVYRGTLEELQQLLAEERENLGQYTLALWLSQRTISHTFYSPLNF